MSSIVTRLYDTYEHASMAVTELESNGVPHANVSLVANNTGDQYSNVVPPATGESAGNGAGAGATVGTVLGGGAGLLAGLGMLAIPGVGPVVAAGWLVATALGAGVGAAGGGILGSLVGAGVSETDAHVYAEGVRRGGTLVTVKADESQVPMVERILDKHSAMDTAKLGDSYRSEGWNRFDETAPAYVAGSTPDLGVPGSANTTARGTPIV